MNTDTQEALSRRYGDDPFLILLLRSGKIAVLSQHRNLLAIVPTLEAAARVAKAYKPQPYTQTPDQTIVRTTINIDLNLDDLGL